MWLILQHNEPDDFCCATGISHTVRDLVNYVFNKLEIPNWEKLIKQDKRFLRPEELDVLKGDVGGINITNPYKMEALNYLNFYDKTAQKIGAVNCIARENKRLKGFNTDWYGFQRTVKNLVIRNAKIIGYGGAGRAVEYVLLLLGVKNIQI